MISLKDEIKKFQNLIYNKQLAQFVTVDQQFVGGGITIESMIRQSSFIVEELKKMNAVFINYCKLNEKVYNKIAEHQINIHQDQTKMNALAASVDRKVTDVLKNLKQLHQNTIIQNAKSAKLLDTVTEPLKKQLENKVDKVTFESQMKKFLEEYDEGGFEKDNISQISAEEQNFHSFKNRQLNGQTEIVANDSGNNSVSQAVLNLDGVPVLKKKGKVAYQDFYKLQSDLHEKMKNSDTKLELALNTALQGKQLTIKYIPTINKLVTDASIHGTEIFRLGNQSISNQNHLQSSINKVLNQLNYRTNDQIFNSKLQNFFEKNIKNQLIEIQQHVKVNKAQLKAQKQDYINKNAANVEEINKLKTQIQQIDKKIRKIDKEVINSNTQIKANHQQFYQQKQRIDKNHEYFKQQTNNKFKQVQTQSEAQTVDLKKTIQNLNQTISQGVFKIVNKRVQAQLKVIQTQIRSSKDKIANLKRGVEQTCEQIQNMKEILSKKANFSDIIHQVQKKADREEFKDLQVKFNESSQQFFSQQIVSKNLNESTNVSKLQKLDKNRGSSLSRANKTVFAARSTPNNRINKTDFDAATKLFMCGFEGHMGGEGRSIMSQHTRRRSIKSSAAVVSDFAG